MAQQGSTIRFALIYLAFLAIAVGAFFVVRHFGEQLTHPHATDDSPTGLVKSADGSTGAKPAQAPKSQVDITRVMIHVLATLAVVILLGNIFGWLLTKIGQPPVIGEVLAGIALGPSLLGAISPDAMHMLIPDKLEDPNKLVITTLQVISQLGIILYMFLVGVELNLSSLTKQMHAALAVSHASITVPFIGGALLALWLFPNHVPKGIPFTSFALFLGAAMAITAFPVLARILTDRGLSKTELGVIALACAATDDVTAWCLLALVVGVANAEVGKAITITWQSLAYLAIIGIVLKPVMERFTKWAERRAGNLEIMAGVLALTLMSALCTEAIGIHAVFGAFVFGVIIPHDSKLAAGLHDRFEMLTKVLLLPAFFALTGMNTQLQLISDWQSWLTCLVVIVIATAGKYLGSYIAARANGIDNKTAHQLGVLMNTRGLMELIILNIGLQLGVIEPALFAMMLIMALVTTFMTGPLIPAPQKLRQASVEPDDRQPAAA
jgi:Kef-type K+ transport system membrane component KefB